MNYKYESFKDYLEGIVSMRDRISQQQDFSQKDFQKTINIGDLVHFGFDTKTGGKRTVKYGLITHTDRNKAVIYQFQDKKYREIPIEQLIYIRYTTLPTDVLITAQKMLPDLFPAGKSPDIDYIGAIRHVHGEIDDSVKHLPKALIRLTDKQLARFKNKVPTGNAPMMSANDLLAFLTKKDPKDTEESNPFLKSFTQKTKEIQPPATAAKVFEKPLQTSPLKAFVANKKPTTEAKPLIGLPDMWKLRKKIEKPNLDNLLGDK